MNALSKSSVAGLLAASILGFAGAAQAVTVTMSATWDSSGLTGTSSTAAAAYNGSGVLSAATTQTWDTATDVGQSRTFTFNNPLWVTVDASVALPAPFFTDNYVGGTSVTFGGVGTVSYAPPFAAALLSHGIVVENTGSAAKITFTQQNTSPFSSVLGADTMQWNVHYVAQGPALVTFDPIGFATYNYPSIQMEVTLLSAVPETGTAAMLALGLVPLVLARRRQRG